MHARRETFIKIILNNLRLNLIMNCNKCKRVVFAFFFNGLSQTKTKTNARVARSQDLSTELVYGHQMLCLLT